MTTETSNLGSSKDIVTYDPQILARAERALRCAAFKVKLFADMSVQGVNLRAITGADGVKNQYIDRPANLLSTENSLLWLIQVGVLRREVDGQGITDSFRLTPLGHFLLNKWQHQATFPIATVVDHLQNFWEQVQIFRFIQP